MTPFQHRAWTEAAVATLVERDDVVGVVGMGSTGATERVDEWSDHDVALAVAPGAQLRYQGAIDWMPESHRVVGVALEHHGGACAVYDDGHVVEWGVATVEGLSSWVADDYAVLLDRGGVADAMAAAAARPFPSNEPSLARDTTLFLASLLKGVGRARRGEVLSARRTIAVESVDALVRAVKAGSPSGAPGLDRLDGMRRLESGYSELSQRIETALQADVETAARDLLRIAGAHLGVGEHGLDPAQRSAVMTRLGWSDPQRATPR